MQSNKLLLVLAGIAITTTITNCNSTKFPFGERIYQSKCADCHMDDGNGLSSLYPSLKTENILTLKERIPCIIRNGVNDTTSIIQMLAMPEISEVEITNVINYILQDLNQLDEEVFLNEVKEIIQNCNPSTDRNTLN